MYKIIIVKTIILLACSGWVSGQVLSPDKSRQEIGNLAVKADFRFSTNIIQTDHHAHSEKECGEKGWHGMISESNTYPWFQAQFDSVACLESLRINFNPTNYPDGLDSFYVFSSMYPIEHTDITSLIASPGIEHIFVEGSITNEMFIPLGFQSSKYLRVQSAKLGDYVIEDLIIMGTMRKSEGGTSEFEERSNSLTHSSDLSQAPVFLNVVPISSSCATCNDGTIHISAGGAGLSLSLDGGTTFVDFKGDKENIKVKPGIYNLLLKSLDGNIIAYPKNPVVVGKFEPEEVNCANGNFMNGWTGWTGGQGSHGNFGIVINNTNIAAPRQVIIQDAPGQAEPNLLPIPLVSPSGQGQFARLGNTTQMNDDAQTLSYSFIVSPNNYSFQFNFAVAMWMHSAQGPDESVFSYTIRNGNNIIATENFTAFNGTLNQFNNSNLFFTNWQSRCFDLIQFLGQQVTVTFLSASCAQAIHGSYAYIDAVCNMNNTLMSPPLIVDPVICQGDKKPSVDIGSLPVSLNYSGHFWVIEQVDAQNQTIPGTSFSTQPIVGSPVALIDPVITWEGLSGQQAACLTRFRVTLHISTQNCRRGSSSVIFSYECGPQTTYCNMVVCDNAGPQLQVQALNNVCTDCDYQWIPSANVSNPNIALPTISNPGGIGTNYTIMSTGKNGCISFSTLEISQVELNGTLEVDQLCVDECSVRLVAKYVTNEILIPQSVNIVGNSLAHPQLPFEFISMVDLGGGIREYIFHSSPFENLGVSGGFDNFTITMSLGGVNGWCSYGNCSSLITTTISVAKGVFHGVPPVYIPNIFYPNSVNPPNAYFRPFFSTVNSTPAAFWCEMKIFDRWGGLVYEKTSDSFFEADCNSEVGFQGGEPGHPYSNELDIFPWNGYVGNNKYTNTCGPFNNQSCKCPQGVYVYQIRYKNCENTIFLKAGDVFLIW